ncbi:hypothetical protein HDK64DRAFT_255885 [Phyllosticta capitalensis]
MSSPSLRRHIGKMGDSDDEGDNDDVEKRRQQEADQERVDDLVRKIRQVNKKIESATTELDQLKSEARDYAKQKSLLETNEARLKDAQDRVWAWEKVVKAIKEAIEVKRDVLWPAGGQRMQEIDRELHGRPARSPFLHPSSSTPAIAIHKPLHVDPRFLHDWAQPNLRSDPNFEESFTQHSQSFRTLDHKPQAAGDLGRTLFNIHHLTPISSAHHLCLQTLVGYHKLCRPPIPTPAFTWNQRQNAMSSARSPPESSSPKVPSSVAPEEAEEYKKIMAEIAELEREAEAAEERVRQKVERYDAIKAERVAIEASTAKLNQDIVRLEKELDAWKKVGKTLKKGEEAKQSLLEDTYFNKIHELKQEANRDLAMREILKFLHGEVIDGKPYED